MSADGVPNAVIFIILCFLFVGAIILWDKWIVKRKGVTYTITYGIRYIIAHLPLAWTVLMFLLGCLIGGLFVHFAATPGFWWP